MTRIAAVMLTALALLASASESRAFDRDRDFGWGAPYNSHLDSYSGRPLGPPLVALPPGYDYYNGRLIRVVHPYGPQVYVPHARPRHLAQPTRRSTRRSASRRR